MYHSRRLCNLAARDVDMFDLETGETLTWDNEGLMELEF